MFTWISNQEPIVIAFLVLVTLTSLLLGFRSARREWRKLSRRSDVQDIKAQIVREVPTTIVDQLKIDLPLAIDEHQLKQLRDLRNQVARLEQEAADNHWRVIGVHVHGYRGPQERDQRPVFAPILFNWKTGEIRAVEQHMRIMTPDPAWFGIYVSRGIGVSHAPNATPLTSLCAPRYQKLEDPNEIVLLGAVYRYK